MDYEIIFTYKSAKFIESLPRGHKQKLKDIIEGMGLNPFSYPYRKIRGKTNLYRIRLGKFRMLYEIEEKEKRIVILKVDKRGKVYD